MFLNDIILSAYNDIIEVKAFPANSDFIVDYNCNSFESSDIIIKEKLYIKRNIKYFEGVMFKKSIKAKQSEGKGIKI